MASPTHASTGQERTGRIEKLWIEPNINLSSNLILRDIGEVPEDDLIDGNIININENAENNNESDIEDRNVMEYNIDDLVNKYGMED